MFGTSFTEPVGKAVLENVFGGDSREMYEYACHYGLHGRGPSNLGLTFRELVGTKNRSSWWRGANIWIQKNFPEIVSSSSIKQLDPKATENSTELSHNFTMPTAERVLTEIFKGEISKMYTYADSYKAGVGGPYDLGAEFREIVKNRNRESWWRGAKKWMEENFPSEL